jgi:PAS domain S-box-containing protein
MVEKRTVRRTKREQSSVEEQLRLTNERFAAALNASPVVVFNQDRDLRYTWIHNPALGFTPDELVGMSDVEIFERAEDAQRVVAIKREVLTRGVSQRQVVPVLDRGVERWYDLNVQPQRDAAGSIIGILCTAVDVTEQKRAEGALEQQVAARTLALREREERLRAILATAMDAIITIDRRGRIDSLNPAAERMFGYTADEAVGQNVRIFMPSPYAEEHDSYLRRFQETGEARIIGRGQELIARHKDGRLFPIGLSVSQVDHLGLYTAIVRDVSQRRALEEELLMIAGEEQQRIGQDLHDQTGQELTALLLLADTLVEEIAAGTLPDVRIATKVRDGVRRALNQVRGFARGLMPVEVDAEGLQAALADLAVTISDLHKVQCAFECPVPVYVNDNKIATHLYRIAQEATTNAIKHAHPRRVVMSLAEQDREILLRVVDDGRGISHVPINSKGLGLRIMRHRANLIGGRLSIAPAGDCGTELVCTLPRGTNHAASA